MTRRSADRAGARGFALVEVLVAALILALMLGVYLDSANQSLRAERMIADRREAVLVARSALEAASATAADREVAESGASGRFRWQARVQPWPVESGGVAVERVEVMVFADDTPRPLVRLATLRPAR